MKKLLWLAAIVPLFGLVMSCNNSLLSNDDSASGAVSDRSISFSPWSLQEPDGSTHSGSSLSSLSNAWFYKDGSYQAYMDPKTGSTTSGSSHTRSEMRETSTWSASGTNTLTVTGRVTKIGSGAITIGQVFNSDDSIPLAELQYTTGGFKVLYEESKGNGSTTSLGGGTGLNSTYTYKLALSGKKLTITVAGKTFTKTPSSAVSGNNFYFKCGNYDQSTSSGSVSTTPYSIAEMSSISISHS